MNRDAKFTNFVEYNVGKHTYKLVYRRYAGLFFTLWVDLNDNELGCLETIHSFVEMLDLYFGNVCELDLVFNFHKVYALVMNFLGGRDTGDSKRAMHARLKELEKLEQA